MSFAFILIIPYPPAPLNTHKPSLFSLSSWFSTSETSNSVSSLSALLNVSSTQNLHPLPIPFTLSSHPVVTSSYVLRSPLPLTLLDLSNLSFCPLLQPLQHPSPSVLNPPASALSLLLLPLPPSSSPCLLLLICNYTSSPARAGARRVPTRS